MPSPYDPTPPHLAALGDSRAALLRMAAAAVALVGLVVGLFVYSAAQEDPDGPQDGTAYQEVDMAATSPGGVSGDLTASLWVDASSPGATVRLDGDSVGVVPAWVTDVEAGLRRVEVIAPDGSTVADTTLWIEAGDLADLDLTGEHSRSESPADAAAPRRDRPVASSPAAPAGSIRVTSTPSGATVAIGGRRVGTTPLSIRGVAPGRHDVSVRRAGYESVTRSVDVRGGGVFETAVDLRRAGGAAPAPRAAPTVAAPSRPESTQTPQARPAAAETGEVEILVRPWGQIVIDGTIHQRESDVLYRTALAPGTHRVVVSHPQLGSQERTVTVTPGSSVRVEVDLSQDGG